MGKFKILIAITALQMLGVFAPLFHAAYVRHTGEEVWLEMRLYDPRDALRGHYVRLQAAQSDLPMSEAACEALHDKQTWYLALEKQADGTGKWVGVYGEKPTGLYLRQRSEYSYCHESVRLALPFERYYMNEYEAQSIERQNARFLLQVFIKNGAFALGELKVLP